MRLLILLPLLFVGARAESMQRQCLCSEFEHCVAVAEQDAEHCAFKCKNHLTKLGGDYKAVRQCVLDQRERIEKTAKCIRAKFGKVCASTSGSMIPRRFTETAMLAGFREATTMLNHAGLLKEATQLLTSARSGGGCLNKCGQATDCYKLACTLVLPSDNEAIATGKACAIESGFTTPVAKEICGCLVKAGLKQLEPMCPKIIIE